MTDHFADAIRSSSAARSSSVRQLRSNARSALARQRASRRALTRSVRVELHGHRAAIIASVRRLLAPAARTGVTPGVDTFTGVDTRPDALSRTSTRWTPSGEPDPAVAVLQVLQVIGRHGEGVRAADIGNELGMDWRRVLAPVRQLLEAGMVEQVEQRFYAAGKASAQW
jgi:hypothetical protein